MLQENERIKVSKNFYLDEFINPIDYHNFIRDRFDYWSNLAKYEIKRFFKEFIHGDNLGKLVAIAQYTRDKYGKSVTINNWATDGPRKESGLRSKYTGTGAPLSAHKDMEAIDMIVSGIAEKDIFKDVISNPNEWYYLGVREIESGTWDQDNGEGWTHLSIRETNMVTIKIIPFYKKK